ncbi:alpha-2-macroglobulin family protein [Flavobacterium sp. MXW15]|uniref:Alpha-2-macroglobulin n=1 Tax=Xanthomonas chitinilytica TaxID=2989819 RepID=A0ABT3JVA8_9XANT|nr:alpha-2-macroglobulin [Xanthomonas sp. H13-6]MCW4454949.1 alpha-2-macroglobulin family protein [Flavobacterium sp. MXW15]MCW4472424.1 alpha-2-macroglobulin family protein [Xanthomonas sp. H13-6]
MDTKSEPNRGQWRARVVQGLLLLVLAVGLGACKRNESGQLPGASGEAIKATQEEVTEFALLRAWPDQRGESLSLALEFSRPLVGTQDFDKLLRFEEKAGTEESSWSLSDDGKTLRYPFVEAARDYTVVVSADLLAADGSRLGKELKQKVHTGELRPVAGFASQGSVLPARDSRGLPVVSVNVQEVDVEFLRVREKQLPTFFSQYQRGGRRGSWELDSDYGDKTPLSTLAEPVYVNRFVLGGKQNERVLTYLPTQDIKELQQPGLYFAVMKRTGSFDNEYDTAFFTVSDIGLHTRAYKDTLFVHTASLQNGAPAKKIELRILDAKGELFLKGQTDANGNALLNYKLDAGHVLVASSGGDTTLLPFNQPALDLSEFAVAGRQNAWFDVFAWSGRDLYRPGETVQVSALLRDNDGKPVAGPDKGAQPVFLRLKQPDGKIFRETRLQPGEQGYFSFEQAIPGDAPTGRWQVEFRTDPASKEAVQGMTLRIEEFLPERMKLDLDSAQKTLKPGEPFKLQADAAYLYGAPADGNRFTARLAVAVEQHPLESLPGYFFGDPTVELPREAKDVIDGSFPADGKLRQDVALPAEAKPTTPIAALLSGSVYETGGRTVTRTLKRVLWPAPALVGVRPLFDDKDGADANSNARFELVRVDADGKPQPAQGLKVTLVRELRDYHWTWNDNRWDYDFTRRFENKETRTIDAGATAAKFDFAVEWGEYRVDVFDPATGLTMRYPFRAGWSWNDDNRGLDARPDKVKLALDKTGYKAGDTLKVTLTPPHAGRGVLLVESDKLLYVQDIDVKPGSTFEIPVSAEWERHDVYVTALVFRGGSAPSKITPARAVGVVHVPMDRKGRRVAVGLVAPKQMRPEQPLPVTVSAPELAGRQAHVTVSAVDVGILNITRFPVPDANAQFFAQRRLGVDAYDIYGRVIESFEGASGKLRFGGDMALAALPQAKRPTARVQTVDLFSGPVKLDAKGNARINLPVPDFNGTLRVSALVYSDDRYGNRDVETLVRAPIVAEASMPRVMAPGDRSTVTLDVQNFTGTPGEFSVRVDGEGPLSLGEPARSARLADGAKATLSFPLTAREGYTVAKVRVRVEGNGFKVDRRYDLPVRAAWPSVLRSQTRTLDPLAPVALGSDFAAGLMDGSVNARMLVSALPPIPFASALQGALNYPYGCAEQTTSKGYAALMLDEATSAMLGADGLSAEARRERMEGAFGRLASMQVANGNFSMWGNDGYVNPWLTPYIAEFLLDAKDAGFAVPDNVLQKALNRLSEDLLAGGNQFYGQERRENLKFANQAYSGYVLARVNRAPLGTLRALYDNERSKAATGLSLVHLGTALALQGDRKRGEAAIAAGFAKSGSDRPGYFGDYGSVVRDDALMIALLHERGLAKPEYDARAVALGRELDVRRNRGWLWLSTQEQVALARLGKALMANQKKLVSGQLAVGDAVEEIGPRKAFGRLFDSAELARGVRFTPQGEPPMFASLEVAGVPRRAPEPDNSVIGIERHWYTTDGKPWSPGPLKEGEALIVRLSVTANSAMPDALLTDLLPAGLEIENFNLGDAKQWADVVVDGIGISDRSDAADVRHEEFRDDRYVAALKLARGRTARVFYLVRAVTPGTYTVPPPLAEDMYRPDLRGVGRSNPTTITVVQP